MQDIEKKPLLEPSRYQETADVIRSGQVPEPDVIAIMRENPAFERWYRKRYQLDDPPA